MASRYARIAGTTLGKKLEELANEGVEERSDLADEVDVARAMLERAIKLYGAVVVDPNGNAKQVTPALKAQVTEALRQALADVRQSVADMVKVNAMAQVKGSLPGHHMSYIATQIAEIVATEVADEDARNRVLEQIEGIVVPDDLQVKTEVRLMM